MGVVVLSWGLKTCTGCPAVSPSFYSNVTFDPAAFIWAPLSTCGPQGTGKEGHSSPSPWASVQVHPWCSIGPPTWPLQQLLCSPADSPGLGPPVSRLTLTPRPHPWLTMMWGTHTTTLLSVSITALTGFAPDQNNLAWLQLAGSSTKICTSSQFVYYWNVDYHDHTDWFE